MDYRHKISPGDEVIIKNEIKGTVEEVIFRRNVISPIFAVEWWHEGQPIIKIFHEQDVERVS